jgi:hypothetical protein
MYALFHTWLIHIMCGNYEAASAEANEVFALADEKGASFWKAFGICAQGYLFALTNKGSDAIQTSYAG